MTETQPTDPPPVDPTPDTDPEQDTQEEAGPDDLAGDPVHSDVATPKAPAAQHLAQHRSTP